MGAMITNYLVVSHPDRILTATLGGAAGLQKGSNTIIFDELGNALDKGQITPLIEFLTPAGKPKPSEQQMKMINTLLLATNDSKALAGVVRSWKEMVISQEALQSNQVPTLSIIGEIDPLKKGVDQLKGTMTNLQV